MKTDDKACCEGWLDALQPGSDSDGHGALLYVGEDEEEGLWMMGGTSPIRFCPWCGKKVKPAPPRDYFQEWWYKNEDALSSEPIDIARATWAAATKQVKEVGSEH